MVYIHFAIRSYLAQTTRTRYPEPILKVIYEWQMDRYRNGHDMSLDLHAWPLHMLGDYKKKVIPVAMLTLTSNSACPTITVYITYKISLKYM